MRRPFIIAIAGPGSNSGKTHLACAVIRHLAKNQKVGAVKIATSTPDHMCARTNLPCDCLRFDGRMRLLTDLAYINKVGKDTGHMFAAGAQPVWWLQTTSDVQIESAEFLHSELRGPKVWVIEGSGPIRAELVDLAIVVAQANGKEPKDSWRELIPKANILAVSHDGKIDSKAALASVQDLAPGTPVIHFSGTTSVLRKDFMNVFDDALKIS